MSSRTIRPSETTQNLRDHATSRRRIDGLLTFNTQDILMVSFLAGVASIFVPGLGQVIKGEFLKFVGIWILVAIAVFFTLTVFGAVFGIPMAIVVYFVQVIDAFIDT